MNERIKFIRKTLGLNQTEFGTKIGVKQGSIASYESGARTPLDAVIASICKEFNVNENWLRNGDGEMLQQRSHDDEISDFVERLLITETDDFKRRLILMLSRLNAREWKILECKARELFAECNENHHLVYRAALSDNNHEATIEMRSARDLDKLESAPTVDSDDDL